MRVGFVTEFCPPYRTGFYERFTERFETKLLFCDTREKWRAFGAFDYEELGGVRIRDRYTIAPRAFTRLRRYDPDVIVGSPVEGFAGQAAYLYARATGTPFVLWTGEWTLPQTTLRTVTFPLVERIYAGADAIVAYGPHVRSYLAELGVDPSEVTVAWNTVDTAAFANPKPGAARTVRERYDVPADAPLALYVGRLVHEKGVEYLVDAFDRMRDRLDRTPHLLVVGDGDERSTLIDRAAEIPTATFPGRIDNDRLPGYYTAADVFVLPSVRTATFREPWGLVVNEAMAAGTPVIATGQVGAVAAGVVSHGETGLVVPERTVEPLAEALVRLFDDESARAEMGDRGARTIRAYDYDRMVDGFAEAFDTLS